MQVTPVLSNATTLICACKFFELLWSCRDFGAQPVIDVVENGAAKERQRSGKGAAQDSKCRGEVRLHTLRCRGVVRGTGGQAISQLQRQSLSSREYIDTSGAHWPVYNIAYRNVRAPTFRPSRTSSREKHRSKMIPHRSRSWIVFKNYQGSWESIFYKNNINVVISEDKQSNIAICFRIILSASEKK